MKKKQKKTDMACKGGYCCWDYADCGLKRPNKYQIQTH